MTDTKPKGQQIRTGAGKMDKICKNCLNSWKRSQSDFKYYGNYQSGFECLKAKTTTYVRADHTCEKWQPKTDNKKI